MTYAILHSFYLKLYILFYLSSAVFMKVKVCLHQEKTGGMCMWCVCSYHWQPSEVMKTVILSRHRSIAGDLAASRPGAAVKRQAEIYSALWDITQPRGHLATSSKLTCYCVLPAKPEHPLNPPDLTHPKPTGPHSEGLSFWLNHQSGLINNNLCGCVIYIYIYIYTHIYTHTHTHYGANQANNNLCVCI